MRDKSLCWRCKYHTYLGNLPAKKFRGPFENLSEMEVENIACYYSVKGGGGCATKPNGPRTTYDTRGDGPECKLFVEGTCDIEKHKREFTRDLGRIAR